MRFENHIGYRFLTDDMLAFEAVEAMYPEIAQKFKDHVEMSELEDKKFTSLLSVVSRQKQTAFYITESVHDKLDMLKVKKNPRYDWSVFNHLGNKKHTYLLCPSDRDEHGKRWDSGLIRFVKDGDMLFFCHLGFRFDEGSKNYGQSLWTHFYVNSKTNEHCSDFDTNINVKQIEDFVYKCLCFIFLSENEFVEMKPGERSGTKKSGKIINSLPVPITIINSKWNITSIRTEGFNVAGHFALYWTGEGRQIPKMIFRQPYEKNGYIRKAANQSILK